MSTIRRAAFLFCFVISHAPLLGHTATGERGAVATGHPLATQAAVDAIKLGGNAVDAAVAAALTLGVVDGHNSGIGGGCFILLRTPTGEYLAFDGRETAPKAATRDMYLRNGKADTDLSQTGALAVGTPGALAAYELALRQHGKLPLADHLRAAAKIARNGFPVDASFARRVRSEAAALAKFPAARELILEKDGSPIKAGAILRQPDLADTYEQIAEHGIAWFYAGSFAARVGEWMKENGGILTAGDFRDYRPQLREPVRASYRGHDVVSFPPPSSGGVHVLQILSMLERFDLPKLGARSPDTWHLIAEAMKLAFADRAHWLGDPDFAPVPRGLLSREYARERAARISLRKSSEVGAGKPANAAEDIFRKHTTHLSTADAEGYWVACTATINTSFGSKVIVPGTGVFLNNEMDDFSAAPGVPNAFGLVGAEANAVAPGKRPLSSMSPTIVEKNGQPVLSIGAAGGPTIISQTLLAIVQTIDFSQPLPQALAAPRIHHQWRPDELRVERALEESIRAELSSRGHQLVPAPSLGASQAVARSQHDGGFIGVADPRNAGAAAGW
jgi:gamma-glutamyltranspeptidase/glutathione hydrolase